MRKILYVSFLLLGFYVNAEALDFYVTSSTYVKDGQKETYSHFKPATLEKTRVDFGAGFEDVLRLQVETNENNRGYIIWLGKGISAKLKWCDLLDKTEQITKSIYAVTYRFENHDQRCVIFYPESSNEVTIYDVNPDDLSHYHILKASGEDLYTRISRMLTDAMDEGILKPERCNGYLDNIYIVSDEPEKK